MLWRRKKQLIVGPTMRNKGERWYVQKDDDIYAMLRRSYGGLRLVDLRALPYHDLTDVTLYYIMILCPNLECLKVWIQDRPRLSQEAGTASTKPEESDTEGL